MISPWLIDQIKQDAEQFGPLYSGLSNHLPMAMLAMADLGAGDEQIRAFRATYSRRLEGLSVLPGYAETFARIRAEIARDGAPAIISAHLPAVVSGWYRHAYHPFIRLAYGVEFGVDVEVAAGLAYLTLVGPNPALERVARRAGSGGGNVDDLFASAAACQLRRNGGMFEHRANLMIEHPLFAGLTLPQTLSTQVLSHTALKVFAATSNFFALHLVTASHAWSTLAAYLGPDRQALLALGLVAGYMAVDAPPYDRVYDWRAQPGLRGASDLSALHLLALGKDDHDYKLAHTCVRQAQHYADPAYLSVAAGYLKRAPTG